MAPLEGVTLETPNQATARKQRPLFLASHLPIPPCPCPGSPGFFPTKRTSKRNTAPTTTKKTIKPSLPLPRTFSRFWLYLAPPRVKRSPRAGRHSGQAHPHLAGGTTAGFTPSISHVHTGAVRAPPPTRVQSTEDALRAREKVTHAGAFACSVRRPVALEVVPRWQHRLHRQNTHRRDGVLDWDWTIHSGSCPVLFLFESPSHFASSFSCEAPFQAGPSPPFLID
jgi:hypothetical protein